MEKEEKIYGIRDEVSEMKGAINLYRKLAQDSFVRRDALELNSQAKNLLSVLGEKEISPGDFEKNSKGMKKFIFSLKDLEEAQFGKRYELELHYYSSMFYSYKVSEELDYFLAVNQD
ncbi:hypothetical protein KAT24_02430 [Candidatus Pacearchaeota archaeon]|nr:hypothetical protein [Candidatus Pacearchaeota archaeon]